MSTESLTPPAVAVIVAVPLPMPSTSPVTGSTVATVSSELEYVTAVEVIPPSYVAVALTFVLPSLLICVFSQVISTPEGITSLSAKPLMPIFHR